MWPYLHTNTAVPRCNYGLRGGGTALAAEAAERARGRKAPGAFRRSAVSRRTLLPRALYPQQRHPSTWLPGHELHPISAQPPHSRGAGSKPPWLRRIAYCRNAMLPIPLRPCST